MSKEPTPVSVDQIGHVLRNAVADFMRLASALDRPPTLGEVAEFSEMVVALSSFACLVNEESWEKISSAVADRILEEPEPETELEGSVVATAVAGMRQLRDFYEEQRDASGAPDSNGHMAIDAECMTQIAIDSAIRIGLAVGRDKIGGPAMQGVVMALATKRIHDWVSRPVLGCIAPTIFGSHDDAMAVARSHTDAETLADEFRAALDELTDRN